MPAPPTDPGAPWLWDFLAGEAGELARVGFRRLQLPPAGKAEGGAGPGCDGYGLYDPRDLGSKPQQGSTPTRYGTADALKRLVAVAQSNGLSVDLDIVLHQLIGGDRGNYRYLGADGRTRNGRRPMHPGCFRETAGGAGTQPQDDVPAPTDDFAFGDEKVYQHCDPAGYTTADALEYGDWLFETTGADGGRIDDVKGLWVPFVAAFMNHGAMAGKTFCAEYFDGNPAPLSRWVTGPPISGRTGVQDFPLHFAIQSACNGLNAASLDGAGYAAWNSELAWGFVDNPDTDTSPGQQVVSSKMLGYAFLLTIPCRTALVYGKDYFPGSVWPGAYGLKPLLDNLIYIHETFAYGKMLTRWVDAKVIVVERDGDGGAVGGSAGLLTGLNFDTANARTVTCATSFGAGVHLHDFTGHHGDIWTNGRGEASFTIPANTDANGRSYVCFSRAGADRPVRIARRRTVQTIFGAEDLDVAPVSAAHALVAGRIFVEGGSVVRFSTSSPIRVALLDGDAVVEGNAPSATGWYGVRVSTGSTVAIPFEVRVDYQAPASV